MNKKIKAKARGYALLLLLLLPSSWFCSSDFEDKASFPPAFKKSTRLPRREARTKPSGNIHKRNATAATKSTKYYNGNEDKVVHIDANAVTTIDDDDDDGEEEEKRRRTKKLSTKRKTSRAFLVRANKKRGRPFFFLFLKNETLKKERKKGGRKATRFLDKR